MGSLFGGDKASKAVAAGYGRMADQMALSRKELQKSADAIEAMGVPAIEAQKIALELGQYGPSALEEIQADPAAALAQYETLEQLGELSGPGLTEEDRAQQFMISQGASRQSQAREKAIMQNMAQRGVGGSGMELAARLQSSQGGADQAAMQQAQMISNKRQARLQALGQRGQLAGQIRQQKYGEQANLASARDRISQFNVGNRAANTKYNKGLYQQEFGNRMAKQQMMANARAGVAGSYQNQGQSALAAGQAQAQGHLAKGAAIGNLAGAAIMAGGFAASDKNLKENVSDSSVEELLDGLHDYDYEYKDESFGEGPQTGVMAQDLEKSELGERFVEDTPEGKVVDYGKMGGTMMAGLANINDRLRELEDEDEIHAQNGGVMSRGREGSGAGYPQHFEDAGIVKKDDPDKKKGSGNEAAMLAAIAQQLTKSNPYEKSMAEISPRLQPIKQPYEDYELADGGAVGNPYLSTPNSNGGFADGGFAGGGFTEGGVFDGDGDFDESEFGELEEQEEPDYRGGELVPGESYAGDRVDAKVNSGEMVINLEQQQRLMDLLKGLTDVQQLGNENIVDQGPGQSGSLGGLGRSEGGAPPAPEGPPAGLPPEAAGFPPEPPMIPEGAQPPMKQGGLVPGEYRSDSDSHSSRRAWKAPRGIHENHASEKKQLEQSDADQKHRKARIKALETLMNGGA